MDIFVVGGAVRDVLLGREPKDIDYVVVGSTPQEMLHAGFKSIPASSFPVFHNKDGDEYALARKEKKVGNGYHGFECEYDTSVTLEEDLYRRDLRINSMAVPLESWCEFKSTLDAYHVIDPYDGTEDIFKQGYGRLDFKMSYDFTDKFSAFFEWQNINDEPLEEFQGGVKAWNTQIETYGQTMTLGVRANF